MGQDAVQYYESKNSEKYLHYKGRLQNVISNPSLLKLLSGGGQTSKVENRKQSRENKDENKADEKRTSLKELELKHQKKVKQRSQQLNFYKEMKKEEEKKSSATHATELLEKSTSKAEVRIEALQSDLGLQDESFKKRLAERKKNRKKGHSLSGAQHFGFLSYSKVEDPLQSMIGGGLESIQDQSTQADSGFHSLNHQRNLTQVQCSFMSDDLFGDESSEVSVSSSVHERVQEEFQNEMKKIWAQTEAQIAKLNITRDKEVERILEKYAELKIDKIAEIKIRYETEIAKCQKKILPKKLKQKLMEKLHKEEESEIEKMVEQLDQTKKKEISDIKVVYEDKRRASMKGSRLQRAMKRMKNLSRMSGSHSTHNPKQAHNRSATLDFSFPDGNSWTHSLYGSNSIRDPLEDLSLEIESPLPKQVRPVQSQKTPKIQPYKNFSSVCPVEKTYIVDEDDLEEM